MTAIANRYEFVYLFDVSNGNPNGDPDAGNMPQRPILSRPARARGLKPVAGDNRVRESGVAPYAGAWSER